MKIPLTETELVVDYGSAELMWRNHRYTWARYGVELFATHEPRHEWTYLNLVRIDIWRFGVVSFYRLLMPRESA